VPAGAALEPLLDAAPDGTALCLAPGVYAGPLQLGRSLTLWGPREAVIRSHGRGTTITVDGEAHLVGLTVDGSGGRYDLLDAAVHVTGRGAEVRGIVVEHAVYGIMVERAQKVSVLHNLVRGQADVTMSLRGDGIRLWEVDDSLVEGNTIDHGRDLVVWYSRRNVIRNNTVRSGRYGTHFMYSHESLAEGNIYDDDIVGVFVMYSHDVTLRGNRIGRALGAAGMGVGLKDSGNVTLEGNQIVHATTGLYLDNSPSQLDHENHVRDNRFRLCDVAVRLHASERRNTFAHNDFGDNRTLVAVADGVDPSGVTWRGNRFDTYAGYDLDGDGVGDLPFHATSAAGSLIDRHPDLAFFDGAPALALTDAVTRLVPLYPQKPMVVDPTPAMTWRAGRPGQGKDATHAD
jgi:nitrous oxidase accessory protein